MSDEVLKVLAVSLLSALLGASELLARYRDEPAALLRISGAWFYVSVNVGAAISALLCVRMFGWEFGQTGNSSETLQVLVAGLGSAALFRSSFFLIKDGEKTIGVGPNLLLQSLLDSADRSVDRNQAQNRIDFATTKMAEFDFGLRDVLVSICLAAAANVPPEEASALGDSVAALAETSTDHTGKGITLGLMLIDTVGPKVLESALVALTPSLD